MEQKQKQVLIRYIKLAECALNSSANLYTNLKVQFCYIAKISWLWYHWLWGIICYIIYVHSPVFSKYCGYCWFFTSHGRTKFLVWCFCNCIFVCFCSVEWLVVDESDKLFEAGKRGFRDQVSCMRLANEALEVGLGIWDCKDQISSMKLENEV